MGQITRSERIALDLLKANALVPSEALARECEVSNHADVIYRLRKRGHIIGACRGYKARRTAYYLIKERKPNLLARFIGWLSA